MDSDALASSKRILPWLVAVAFFMESLDTTILNTAVPAISEALHVSVLSMKAVLASYTLSLAVFIPISGWVADRFGTRRVFTSAIGIFTLGSLLCGLATDLHALVFFRILQGVGGAMMVPVGRLTLVRTFPKSQLVRAMAFVAILALSLTLIFAYVYHSRSEAYPLLRLSLLRIRTVRVAVGGAFLTRIAIGGMPFLLPMLYQVGMGYSPLESGLLIFPQSLAAMSLRIFMPRILRRLGYRNVLLGNTVMIGALIALFALVGPGTPVAVIVAQAFAFGFFSSFQYTSMNTLTYADVSDELTSNASTIASTAQQMSMSFGVAAA